MEKQSDLKFHMILENIRLHFDFLFRHGFRIAAVLLVDQYQKNWQVTLMGDDRLIEIYSEQGKINLALGVLQFNNEIKYFDLEELVRFIPRDRGVSYRFDSLPSDEIQQIKQLAPYLKKHSKTIWAQVEKETFLILNHTLSRSVNQQKRTII